MRDKNYRMHQEERIIKKRMKIVKQWKSDYQGFFEEHPLESEPHRMHKWNMNCGCMMCKYYKHVGNNKEKYRHRDRKLISSFKIAVE